MRALILSWDGSQQTYLESLFFPIFAALSKLGVEVEVLQLTWADAAAVAATERAARRFGIRYRAERTSRRFGLAGQLSSVVRGARLAAQHMRARGIDVLFPRSLLPASMALLALRRLPSARLVFDADGLMADERVDFAGWSQRSPVYLALRAIECTRRAPRRQRDYPHARRQDHPGRTCRRRRSQKRSSLSRMPRTRRSSRQAAPNSELSSGGAWPFPTARR